MRKLMWFSLGFAAVCAVLAYHRMPVTGILAAGFFLMSVLTLLLGRKWRFFRVISSLLLGMSLGVLWFARFEATVLTPVSWLQDQTLYTQLRITDYSYDSGYGTAADAQWTYDGKTYKTRVYLTEEQNLRPGQTLKGDFAIRLTNPGQSESDTYFRGEGIFLLAYQKGNVSVREEDESLRDVPARLRRWIHDRILLSFPEDTEGFALALLLGDTSLLDYETDTALKVSGIRHVAAVSGLHVSILFALLSTVTLRNRFLLTLVGIPVLILFAAVAGFSPSVNRACIMSGLMLLSRLLNRDYDGLTAVSFSALVMLLVNPMAAASVSLQLSAASVVGIFLFSPGIDRWLRGALGAGKGKSPKAKLLRWVCGSVSVSLGAMPLTTPLCAYYFGAVSLVGVVTNLLTLWVISFVFYGIMTVCLLSAFWAQGATIVAAVISVPIRFVLGMAKLLSGFPFSAVYVQSKYIVLWLIFVYLLLMIFLLSKKKEPVALVCCACIGLCASLWFSCLEPKVDDTRLTVLDVGQGQCILLQTEGKSFLVDCGGSSGEHAADTAAQTLLSQGISRLDGVIVTHLDEDHAGGIPLLLSRVDTSLLILPGEHNTLWEHTEGEVVYAAEALEITFGTGKIRIYPPTYPGTSNEKSVCVLFDSEKCDILITGDRTDFGERMLLRNAVLPDVDVLIAGHHGAADATAAELLEAVKPEIVCISVGADNIYGHPAPALLQRLEDFGAQVYRTDLNGTIIIRR